MAQKRLIRMSSSLRHRISLVVLSILTLAAGLLLYGLANSWLQHEFSRAAIELSQDEAESAAHQLANRLPQASALTPLPSVLDDKIGQALTELIYEHPHVVLALISDSAERVVFCLHGRNELARFLRGNVLGGALHSGIDQETLINDIKYRFPGLVMQRHDLKPGNRLQASVVVFVDPSAQQDLVRRATFHITRDLTPLLIVAVVLGGVILWFLRRQRRLTEHLRMQRDQAESLAHVGTLAAGLAHEIRNPVNALAMQLEMLEEDLANSARENYSSRVARIRAGLSNLERTIHDFLNYALPHQQRPAHLDLAVEIATVANEVNSGQEDHSPELQIRIPEGLHAWCDPHAFRQILSNLLSNALHAQRPLSTSRISITAYRERRWVIIAVEDAGPGVSAENRQNIFNCFFTTEPDGTGLGLPIARRLAQLNGGELELAARSVTLNGARFELRLPPAEGST